MLPPHADVGGQCADVPRPGLDAIPRGPRGTQALQDRLRWDRLHDRSRRDVGSNNDPFASKPTGENEWAFDGRHLMLIVPDEKALEGLPTTRPPGAPFVMFSGTPYAHIMIPVVDSKKK